MKFYFAYRRLLIHRERLFAPRWEGGGGGRGGGGGGDGGGGGFYSLVYYIRVKSIDVTMIFEREIHLYT